MPLREGAQETIMSEAVLERKWDPLKTMAVLVAQARTSKMITRAAAPRGMTGTSIEKRVADFLRDIGCLRGDMIVSCDQEPVFQSVVEDVGPLQAADGSGVALSSALT